MTINKKSTSSIRPSSYLLISIFLVSSRKKSEVTGIDASIMLNLLYSFDMWLQANEDTLIYSIDENLSSE